MPHFIECSIPSIVYLRGETRHNHPVNLDLCKSIHKSKMSWYPDNVGKPSIMFDGADVEWAFDNADDRDSQFARIILER